MRNVQFKVLPLGIALWCALVVGTGRCVVTPVKSASSAVKARKATPRAGATQRPSLLVFPAQVEHSDRVKIHEKQWSLAGSARIVAGPEPYLELRYCCVRWSEATARIEVEPGRHWRLAVDYRADCDRGTNVHILAVGPRGTRTLRTLPLSSLDLLMKIGTFRFKLKPEENLYLMVRAVGGKSCCGRTRIRKVTVTVFQPG